MADGRRAVRHGTMVVGMLAALFVLVLSGASAMADDARFPPPEFDPPHEIPPVNAPEPTGAIAWDLIDIALLLGAIAIATVLVLRLRRRGWIFALMLASLAYFGFVRGGCICPIGAIQNITLGLVDSGYAVPFVAVAFFVIVIVMTLLFGRTFCGAVCPLGAIQDIVALRPFRLPRWLSQSLGLGAWVVLAVGVAAVAASGSFLICRYDPFVGFFRLGGAWQLLILGGVLLVIGVFVARPYCRFLCPLGAVLRVCGRVSWKHVTVTPDECVDCRLCEDACPFDAIDPPTEGPHGPRRRGMGRLALLLLLGPVVIALLAVAGWLIAKPMARLDWRVDTMDRVLAEVEERAEGRTIASVAWRQQDGVTAPAELTAKIAEIEARFEWALAAAGAFVGLVVWLKLASLNVRRTRTEYTANRAHCLACGRCFAHCPVEHRRRKGATL